MRRKCTVIIKGCQPPTIISPVNNQLANISISKREYKWVKEYTKNILKHTHVADCAHTALDHFTRRNLDCESQVWYANVACKNTISHPIAFEIEAKFTRLNIAGSIPLSSSRMFSGLRSLQNYTRDKSIKGNRYVLYIRITIREMLW